MSTPINKVNTEMFAFKHKGAFSSLHGLGGFSSLSSLVITEVVTGNSKVTSDLQSA